MAISAYLEASWTRGRPELRERALQGARLPVGAAAHGRPGHVPLPRARRPAGIGGLLGDQAWTAAACLDAYEVAGRPQDLERAQSSWRSFMLERLAAPGGGFYDTPRGHETLGRLSSRAEAGEGERRRRDGVHAPRAAHARRSGTRTIARRALAQFADVAESQGYFAADYARAVDLLLNPGAEVKIVARAGAAAGRAARRALALPVPDRIVRVIDAGRRRALAAEALPPHPAPAAYACYGTLCSRAGHHAGRPVRDRRADATGVRIDAARRATRRTPRRRHGERLSTSTEDAWRDQANEDIEPPAPERGLLSQIRLGAGIGAALLLLLFMAQNLQRVEIHFLWFDWNTRLLFALVLAAAFGGISSVVAVTLTRRARRRARRAERG